MADSIKKIKAGMTPPTHKVINGEKIPFTEEEASEVVESWAVAERERQLDVEKNGYKVERVSQYPSLAEQLDNLFKDIEAGFFGAKAKNSEFYKSIKLVKDSNPKPSEEEWVKLK